MPEPTSIPSIDCSSIIVGEKESDKPVDPKKGDIFIATDTKRTFVYCDDSKWAELVTSPTIPGAMMDANGMPLYEAQPKPFDPFE